MALNYNTENTLAEHPAVIKFSEWIWNKGTSRKVKHRKSKDK